MILYKNVDICDLDSIVEKGILSLDDSGNRNWGEGKRADNPTNVVYLFHPIDGGHNSFPSYGVALLEVDIEDAKRSDFCENDAHKFDYIEFVVSKVEPSKIRRVIIPEIFRNRLNLSEGLAEYVEWCGFTAEVYGDSYLDGLKQASDEILATFAKTADIEDSSFFNFFRGTDGKNDVFDIYNIKYIF